MESHKGRKPRKFSVEFKEGAARRLLGGESGTALSRELNVKRSVLYRWRDTYRNEGVNGLSRRRGRPAPGHSPPPKIPRDPRDERIAGLEQLLGKQAAELDFFEQAFRALNLAAPTNDTAGASSTPVPFGVLNGVLVFRAFEPATGIEVWKTGGSAAGTTIVKDINPGTVRSSPTLITNSNGALLFSASLTATGTELWRSDGSTVGTVLFTDINSSPSSSTPIILTNVNGTLFFSAPDSTFSRRLWNSDRTEAGT